VPDFEDFGEEPEETGKEKPMTRDQFKQKAVELIVEFF